MGNALLTPSCWPDRSLMALETGGLGTHLPPRFSSDGDEKEKPTLSMAARSIPSH